MVGVLADPLADVFALGFRMDVFWDRKFRHDAFLLIAPILHYPLILLTDLLYRIPVDTADERLTVRDERADRVFLLCFRKRRIGDELLQRVRVRNTGIREFFELNVRF